MKSAGVAVTLGAQAGSAYDGTSYAAIALPRNSVGARHLESRRGADRVAAGIWVDVDFHGGLTGSVRDAVMRAVRVDG